MVDVQATNAARLHALGHAHGPVGRINVDRSAGASLGERSGGELQAGLDPGRHQRRSDLGAHRGGPRRLTPGSASDADCATDTQLVSPDLVVGSTAPLVIAFDHKFSFETDTTKPTYFDGGVIELSTDGGHHLDRRQHRGRAPATAARSAPGNALVGRQGVRRQEHGLAPMRDHLEARARHRVRRPDGAPALPHRHRRRDRRPTVGIFTTSPSPASPTRRSPAWRPIRACAGSRARGASAAAAAARLRERHRNCGACGNACATPTCATAARAGPVLDAGRARRDHLQRGVREPAERQPKLRGCASCAPPATRAERPVACDLPDGAHRLQRALRDPHPTTATAARAARRARSAPRASPASAPRRLRPRR